MLFYATIVIIENKKRNEKFAFSLIQCLVKMCQLFQGFRINFQYRTH